MTFLYAGYLGTQAQKLPKKLIEYGWDVPTPTFVQQNIQQMEKRPFDGIIMNLQGGKKVFLKKPYELEEFEQDLQSLQATTFSKFTDNFILMWVTTDEGWDWFNDSDWNASEQNIRLFAKMVLAGRCIGIAFDPEPYKQYGANPWLYTNLPRTKEKSFEEYWQQIRKRGAQFIQILQEELPSVKLLTFFQLSYLSEFLDEPDAQERMRQLSTEFYGLLPAFLNGMLDAAQPNTVIVDGNENAYYYSGREPFFQTAHLIKEKALTLVEPENRSKYDLQVKVGQALYIDHLFALRQPQESFVSYYLTPEERAKWLEHNTYYALSTSDEYVWCYSEKMNWWTNNVPDGAEEAIRVAQYNIQAGKPLSFNIEEIIQRAEQMMRQSKIRNYIAQWCNWAQSLRRNLAETFSYFTLNFI